MAQQRGMGKMSPWLRQLVRQEGGLSNKAGSRVAQYSSSADEVCVFVRIHGDAEAVLQRYGSKALAHKGNIYIAAIPISQLYSLSNDENVSRIEARPYGQALLDSAARAVNLLPAHEGRALPQAFTGKGVVVGVMDIGFDLTHPTFYSRDLSSYRIKALWDMLSRDTLNSSFPVGRDYTTEDELLTLAHSYDGLNQTHGTHTAGIAAGSGYDSPYRGVAPESDICLVANAVSNNVPDIEPEKLHKFTFATDALGFKYMFDYAEQQGRPCVISFSEGSGQDFKGYDVLYYEMLDSLMGPGRIIVSAAGNQSYMKTWFHKPIGEQGRGTFLKYPSSLHQFTLKSAEPFNLRMVVYGESQTDTLLLSTDFVLAQPDSIYTDTLSVNNQLLVVQVEAYPSCYITNEICFDVNYLPIGLSEPYPYLSAEILGIDADVEFWRGNCQLLTNVLNPSLNAGENTHNILSPSSSPRIICVGATCYRDSVLNVSGQWRKTDTYPHGQRISMSSVGPTMDGRIKPDVMAPGGNVISAYSSYYLEHHSDAYDITWDVAHFPFRNRTYAWNSNTGTSMACPVVAGAIALWLQAKPDLTPEEALDVIRHTSKPYDTSLSYPNNEYGYGELDVYAGLLYLLGIDQIKDVSKQHTSAKVSVRGRQLHISLPAVNSPVSLRLYSLSGVQVMSQQIPVGHSDYSISLAALAQGVYAVQISGDVKVQGSTLIRVNEWLF